MGTNEDGGVFVVNAAPAFQSEPHPNPLQFD